VNFRWPLTQKVKKFNISSIWNLLCFFGQLKKKILILAFYTNLLKSTLNKWFFNIIYINSNNMFILIIKLNNILKFDMLKLGLCLLYIFLDKDHKMYTWSCFHPHLVKKARSPSRWPRFSQMDHIQWPLWFTINQICHSNLTFNQINHSNLAT